MTTTRRKGGSDMFSAEVFYFLGIYFLLVVNDWI